MRNLFRPPTPIAVSAPAEAVAGQPLEVTLRFVADRALEVSGGEVELVRTTAVTHFRHQWMGAGGTVGHRSTAVPRGLTETRDAWTETGAERHVPGAGLGCFSYGCGGAAS